MSTRPGTPEPGCAQVFQGTRLYNCSRQSDRARILGEKAYPDLLSIPRDIHIDTVEIFLRSEDVPPIVEQAIQIGAKVIWMQEGVRNEGPRTAEAAGLQVVQRPCMRAAHRFFFAEPENSVSARCGATRSVVFTLHSLLYDYDDEYV